MKKYSVIIAGVLLAACTSTKTATTTQTTSPTPQKQVALSTEQLNHGKELYSMHCASCHSLKRPTSESAEEWKHIVPEMVAKANRKKPNSIDDNTKEILLNYLVALSNAGTDNN